jgi:phosphohistidine phosphatase
VDLYLIRHGDAQPVDKKGVNDDADRPLTDEGKAQCKALATALERCGVRLGLIASSPLLRARQTAEELLRHWSAPAPELRVCQHLAPDSRNRKLTRFLLGLEADSVALVGHMPDLATYAAWLIGSKKVQLDVAKGGVARIECEDKPAKGAGLLTWLVTPAWYH